MKKAKKVLSVVLAFVLLACSLSLNAFAESYSGENESSFIWSFDSDTGMLEMSGSGMPFFDDKTDAPWYEYRADIKSVKMTESITGISNYAFYECENLLEINLHNGIRSLGDYAFAGCKSLVSITIPDSVIAFFTGVFLNCSSLESIVIGKGLMHISQYEFWGCDSLGRIIVDEANQNYSCDSDGVLYNKDKTELIKYPCGRKVHEYKIPDNVTAIGFEAFHGSMYLESVVIHDNVTSIGEHAFSLSDKLEKVVFGKGFDTIPRCAFWGCDSLRDVILPDNIVEIGEKAFESWQLRRIHIPASVTEIGEKAFGSEVYICSDTEDCYAKTYAEENGFEFVVCDNKHERHVVTDLFLQQTAPTIVLAYGKSTVLNINLSDLPRDAKIEWRIDGDCISAEPSVDGSECKITSLVYGDASVTVCAVDENGEVLVDWDGNEVSDTIVIKVKLNLWLRIIMSILNFLEAGELAFELYEKYWY